MLFRSIDAGHGGKDPGAKGVKTNEKIINLAVALKLGKMIAAGHDDVQVIYTHGASGNATNIRLHLESCDFITPITPLHPRETLYSIIAKNLLKSKVCSSSGRRSQE